MDGVLGHTMKIYLASSFDQSERVELLSGWLEARGHTITQKWWYRDFKELAMDDGKWYEHPMVKIVSEGNFKGIDEADVLILVGPSDNPKKFNGANVEAGYAMGTGKPVLSYGRLERSAMYVPVIQTKNLSDLSIALHCVGERLCGAENEPMLEEAA